MINSIENAFAKNITLKKISISQNDILKSLTEIPRKEENKTRTPITIRYGGSWFVDKVILETFLR